MKSKSPFYKEKLADFDEDSEFTSLPFTTSDELREFGHKMICVRQDEISRIVTLETSGTTGLPKRVYFTRKDQENIIDYFEKGMEQIADSSDTFLILLPCKRPASVGDLLKTAVERSGMKTIPYGIPENLEDVKNIMEKEKVTSMVGVPNVVTSLSEISKDYAGIKTTLLASDYVSEEDVDKIKINWGAMPFENYGMTEMGFGGGVSCEKGEGYHLSENDLYFEIIDKDGTPISDERFGELVFTTLTRQGMPLIRYKTGDITRWINEPCSCGSKYRRIDRIRRGE